MSRKRKISLISLVIILVFVTVGSAYFAVAGSYLKKTIDKGYVPIKMIIMKRKIKIVNRF